MILVFPFGAVLLVVLLLPSLVELDLVIPLPKVIVVVFLAPEPLKDFVLLRDQLAITTPLVGAESGVKPV